MQMIRKNQFMIEGNHKIQTPSRQEAPDNKLGVQNYLLGRQFFFTRPKNENHF